jgi:hypothetical protein
VWRTVSDHARGGQGSVSDSDAVALGPTAVSVAMLPPAPQVSNPDDEVGTARDEPPTASVAEVAPVVAHVKRRGV